MKQSKDLLPKDASHQYSIDLCSENIEIVKAFSMCSFTIF
jgi:hypothetical protein